MEGALFYSARRCYGYPGKARAPTPNAAPARFKVRKNIDSYRAGTGRLSPAVKQMLNDKRGFDYFAGWHGAAPLVPALPW
jgi:hypothetical protein